MQGSPRRYLTVIVIFSDSTGLSCGMCRKSAKTSCSVWEPAGSVISVSVCPPPKWRTLSVTASAAFRSGRFRDVDEQVMVPGCWGAQRRRRDPHSFEPNRTVNGAVTVSPFLGEMMYTDAPSADLVFGTCAETTTVRLTRASTRAATDSFMVCTRTPL